MKIRLEFALLLVLWLIPIAAWLLNLSEHLLAQR